VNFLYELAKELLSFLNKRQWRVVIVFGFCAFATFIIMLALGQTLLRQIFVVGLWVFVGSLYLIFSTKLQRRWRIVTFVIVSVGSVGWFAGAFYVSTSDNRHAAALMESADALFEKGLYLQSANKLDEAITLARKNKLQSKEMRCLLDLGLLNYLLGNHDRAQKLLASGQALAIELESPDDQAQAFLNLADGEQRQGKNDLARQYYCEARELYQKLGDRLGMANVLIGLGNLDRELGNNKLARRHYFEARRLYQKLGCQLGMANVLCVLGDLDRKLGNNDLARRHYGEARGLYQKLGHWLGKANVLSGLGYLEWTLGNNDLARQYYGEARGLYQKLDERLGEAGVLYGLGELDRKLGNNDLARHYCEARRIYSAFGKQKNAEYLKKKLNGLDSQ